MSVLTGLAYRNIQSIHNSIPVNNKKRHFIITYIFYNKVPGEYWTAILCFQRVIFYSEKTDFRDVNDLMS